MAELSATVDCTPLAACLVNTSSGTVTSEQLLALHEFFPCPRNLFDSWLAQATNRFNHNNTWQHNIPQPHLMGQDLRHSIVSQSTQESSEPAGSLFRSSFVSAGSSHTSAHSEFPHKQHMGDNEQLRRGIDSTNLLMRKSAASDAASSAAVIEIKRPSAHISAPVPPTEVPMLGVSVTTGGTSVSSGSNFFCTRCTKVFRYKNDWNRHEQTEHEHQVVFICMPHGPIDSFPEGPRCSSCHELNPSPDHMERQHSTHKCLKLSVEKRAQHYWPDRFNRHHQDHFTCPRDCPHSQQWRFELPKRLTYYCGFTSCLETCSTWNDWFNHVATHIEKGGMRREQWNHTKIIWYLLTESRMVKAWATVLDKHFPVALEQSAITWSGHAATSVQQLLEHSQESPAGVATEAFKQSSQGWRVHQLSPTGPAYNLSFRSNPNELGLMRDLMDVDSVTSWLPSTQDANSNPYTPFIDEMDNGAIRYLATPDSEPPSMLRYPDSSTTLPHGLDHSYNTANLSKWAKNAGVISFNETPVLSPVPDRTSERPPCPKTPLQAIKGAAKKLVPRRASESSSRYHAGFAAPLAPAEEPPLPVADISFFHGSYEDSPMSDI